MRDARSVAWVLLFACLAVVGSAHADGEGASTWATVVSNQSRLHTLAKTPKPTQETLAEIAAVAKQERELLIRMLDEVKLDELNTVRLRRSVSVAVHAANSVGSAGESLIPGSVHLPLHRFDIQLQVVETHLPESVINGNRAREPEDIDTRKIR